MSDAQLKELRNKWLRCLNDHPNHAIWDQIMGAWRARSLFWAVNHMRKLGSEGEGSSANNGLIAGMIDFGYAATQILRISNLVGKGSDAITLRKLLNDIKENRERLTRASMIGALNLPYDYESEKPLRNKKIADWIAEDPSRKGRAHPDQFGMSDVRRSENFHCDWDKRLIPFSPGPHHVVTGGRKWRRT